MNEQTLERFRWQCDRCTHVEILDERINLCKCPECGRWMKWSRLADKDE